ncbi:Hsp20/alpha crystallin family [Musa troglodytarum]|uniref:Hsp20/alpha crystallin family n=1 Tax=Musa troglodytarum TaxID=320322 RepID=A0A9E7GNX5_9LILI|nr:Hsp20/alpha crystallin family [Musa troglodytarum]
MDVRLMGLDGPLMSTLHHLVDLPDEVEKALSAPTRTYVRDARAMAATPADVKELPGVYVFVVDMPELKPNEIKVQVEDDCVLVVSGERRRREEEEEKEVKYLRMERRMGKFLRRFSLPENANVDVVSATYKDGVLTITVEKLPPPEPKKPKTIEVKVA